MFGNDNSINLILSKTINKDWPFLNLKINFFKIKFYFSNLKSIDLTESFLGSC